MREIGSVLFAFTVFMAGGSGPAFAQTATNCADSGARAGAPYGAYDRLLAATPEGYRYPLGRVLAVYGALMVTLFFAALDQTIVSTAGPKIQKDLANITDNKYELSVYFGKNVSKKYEKISRMFFNLFLPTSGVLLWDFATNDWGELSNVDCLNTMTTSGVAIKLTFTGTQSVSAYAVMGIEGLTFVNAG
jgi:hypothetical protein